MGRPPIGKKPMTDAERQRRRRKRLRTEEKAATKQDRRAKNAERSLPPADKADKVVSKIAKALRDYSDLSIDDIRAAIDRRWPRAPILQQIASEPAAAPRDDKLRQDTDAYRLEQARVLL